MKKTDAYIGTIIGFLIGVFFFVSLKTLSVQVPLSWLIIVVFPPLTLLGLFLASILGKKLLAVFQLAKFLLVGAMNTFLDLGILNFLMWLSGIYAGAFFAFFKGISFLIAATNSYLWNKHWTFGQKNGVFVRREYFKFLIVVLAGLLINVGVASFVVTIIGPQFGLTENLWANVGAFSAVFVGVAWNFIGSKFIVFKK